MGMKDFHEFFELQPLPAVVAEAQGLLKTLMSIKVSGKLMRAIETQADRLDRRKACRTLLEDVKKGSLEIRPAILEMAKKAVTKAAS